MTPDHSTEVLRGTLDLLILKTVALEPMHGWGISQRIQQMSDGLLEVNQGSLYPALYRLQDRGLIEGSWGVSDEGRRAKFYRLTRAGERAVEAERESWEVFTDAVNRVLDAT